MKKFIVELLTNRFGIVLAALNVCYCVSRKFVYSAFSHGDGNECIFHISNAFFWGKMHYAETFLSINLPAALAALIQGKLIETVFPDLCFFTHAKIQIIFLAVFITIQWLFVSWTAKTIARAIRPTK